jgi:hypothetical protein
VTTYSGVIAPGHAAAWSTGFADAEDPSNTRSDEEANRPYIELARELATRLGLASPSLPTNRRSVE